MKRLPFSSSFLARAPLDTTSGDLGLGKLLVLWVLQGRGQGESRACQGMAGGVGGPHW